MRKWRLVAIIVVLVALAAAVCVGGGQLAANLVEQNQQIPAMQTPMAAAPHLRAQGKVLPVHRADLGFASGGVLAEVAVAPQQTVQGGELLARLDAKALVARVTSAEAELEVARAQLEKLKAGPSDAELMVAQLEVMQAEADLAKLTTGPLASELVAAQAAVQDVEREVENAKQNLIVVQKSDVVSKNVRDREYEHNWFETNYGEYQKKFDRGEIDQTRLDLEWNALLTAKERLDAARAEAALALGTAEAQVTQSEETLRQAKAHLADLQREPDAQALAVANLVLEKARAQWEQLNVGPNPADLIQSEAAVQAAEMALELAQAEVEATTLTAPFAGTVIAVNAGPGEVVGSLPFITLADLTTWQVETVDVDEWLMAHIEVGQPVALAFPAFDRKVLNGVVVSIAPRPEQDSGSDPFYTVVVALDGADGELRWGMTARLDFGEER
jgi:HlyD family secretion protein